MRAWQRAAVVLTTVACIICSAARAESPQTAKIGVVRLTGSIPIYIATDKGYFRDEGLDPQLIWFDASAALPVAIASGDIDFGSAAFTGALFNIGAKGGLKIIASQLRDTAGYRLNALMATKSAYGAGFTKITDLPSKRIGMTTVGSTMHYTVALLAKKYRFDLSAVTLVPLQSLANLNSAFAGGSIDGGVIAVAAAKAFEADGSGKVIAWTGDEAPWQLGAQITRPQLIKERPEEVAEFVHAYQRGISTYQKAVTFSAQGQMTKGPGYDEIAAIIGKYLNLAPDKVADIFPSFDPTGALDVADVKNQVAFYQAQGMVDKSADVDAMLDLSFLEGTAK
jgi:NitT/TauT family transport system substrate-binding protein